jgi:hypothetical protein
MAEPAHCLVNRLFWLGGNLLISKLFGYFLSANHLVLRLRNSYLFSRTLRRYSIHCGRCLSTLWGPTGSKKGMYCSTCHSSLDQIGSFLTYAIHCTTTR